MNKFLEVMENVKLFILGDRRDGDDRRVKKSKEKEQEENQIVELLKGIEDTQLKIIKVLNRIERNF